LDREFPVAPMVPNEVDEGEWYEFLGESALELAEML
jgi:hypothetical protein